MDANEKNVKKNEMEKGFKAIIELGKSGGEEVYMNPANWPMMLEALKFIVSSFLGMFGWGGSKKIEGSQLLEMIENQKALIELETKRNVCICAIKEHLENTCLNQDQVSKIMSDFSTRVAEDVATEIPGQLLSVEAEIPAQEAKKMRFVRKAK